MKLLETISIKISNIIGISSENVKLVLLTLIVMLGITIIKIFIKKMYSKVNVSDREKYFYNRKMQITLNILTLICIIIIWGHKLQGLVTIISFISAGMTIALREIIFNFFAGIYIKFTKPFELEDRIEIDNLKGDVINIHALGFEILEIGERVNGEQSSGRIVHIPNSMIFTKPLENYVKAFKYIWNEMTIKVDLDSDIESTKQILYEIVNTNEILKEIPKKMEDAVDEAILEYRIYFNNLEPIIYTKIVDSHIELYLRYLVHPKKARTVEDEIYEQILQKYKTGEIKLYKDS